MHSQEWTIPASLAASRMGSFYELYPRLHTRRRRALLVLLYLFGSPFCCSLAFSSHATHTLCSMLVPKMITLIRMDAAFRCLQHYDPDLDCSPLTADWSKLNAKDRASHYAQTHVLRMMMMARIADIGVLYHAHLNRYLHLTDTFHSQTNSRRRNRTRRRNRNGRSAHLEL